MRSPLDVVLLSDTGRPDLHISSRITDDYEQTSTSPGGYATITYSLREPLLADALLDYHTAKVSDRRTAEQVHGGRLVIPGKSTDSAGDVWQIQVIGEGPAHMQDTEVSRIYIDSSLDGFEPAVRFVAAATAEVGSTPDGTGSPPAPTSETAVVITAPGGTVLGNGVIGAMFYRRLVETGQQLGGVGYTRLAGKADTNYQNELAVHADDGSPAGVTTVASNNWTISSVAVGPFVVGTDWAAGMDIVRLNVRKSLGGATTIADDTTWGAFYSVFVRARLKTASGGDLANASHSTAYVLVSDVIADLLGRDLPRFDGANAVVDTTTHHVDQLAFLDGATPQQIVEELLKYETDHTWHVWDVNPATDLYRFEFTSWGTTVRYEASVVDGFDAPAPTDDLYNECRVRYVDKKGRTRIVVRTQTVAALGSLTRSKLLDLGVEEGSLANAQRAGDQFLARHATPPNRGSLRVARPVYDRTLGRMAQPWELRPGGLVRVRGIRPYIDSLNATDRDGVTVFRVVRTTFNDGDGACTLELDNFVDDETQAIVELTKKRRRKR